MKSHSEDWLKSILATAPTKALQRLVEDTVCVLEGGACDGGRYDSRPLLDSSDPHLTRDCTHTHRQSDHSPLVALPPAPSNCLLSINDQLRTTSFFSEEGAHSLFVCLFVIRGGGKIEMKFCHFFLLNCLLAFEGITV